MHMALLGIAWLATVSQPPGKGPPPPVRGDAVIRAPFGRSDIVITTTSRVAGAIHSLRWNGKEFIDSHDHGRQLQSASNFDFGGRLFAETFNPTEAGSRRDGMGPRSTSQLLELRARDNEISTRNRMAFWLRPGELSDGHPAYNRTALSNHELSKRVRIGFRDMPNVLDYQVTFTLPKGEQHTQAVFEALTGYMPADFVRFEVFDPVRQQLLPLSDGPGEQPLPIVFSTRNGSHAMGIFTESARKPGYGRWRFPTERVVKWNCVFRVNRAEGIASGDYRFPMYVPVGTREDCLAAMKKLHRLFPEQPPGQSRSSGVPRK